MSGSHSKFGRHRVHRGDTLWKLALQAYGHGELWEEIANANHLKPGRPILVGQWLYIPMARQSAHLSGRPPIPGLRRTQPSYPTKASPVPHIENQTIYAGTKSGPFQLARPVLFPEFKYSLNGVVLEQVTPNVEIKLSYTGEVTMRKEGTISGGLTLTKEGAEAEYKKEADGVFSGLFSKSTMKVENGKAEVSLAVGSTLKSGSQVLATTETALIPPNGIKYTYKGQEIKGTYQGYEFAGVMGYELEIHFKPNEPANRRYIQVTHWAKVAGVALVVGAAVLVIVDIVKDIGTLGWGTLETPLSWAAAAAMFGRGMTMLRTVSP